MLYTTAPVFACCGTRAFDNLISNKDAHAMTCKDAPTSRGSGQCSAVVRGGCRRSLEREHHARALAA